VQTFRKRRAGLSATAGLSCKYSRRKWRRQQKWALDDQTSTNTVGHKPLMMHRKGRRREDNAGVGGFCITENRSCVDSDADGCQCQNEGVDAMRVTQRGYLILSERKILMMQKQTDHEPGIRNCHYGQFPSPISSVLSSLPLPSPFPSSPLFPLLFLLTSQPLNAARGCREEL